MQVGNASSPLPRQTRSRTSIPRVGYETFMSLAIPGALLLISAYLFHAGWEYVLIPWCGRESWGGTITLGWSMFLVCCAWCGYYTARFTDPGSVPAELGEQMRRMPQEMRNEQNWCLKCENVKPPRAHHCQRCKRCVLRMDHHCVALGNCVGLYNYKYFLSTFFYLFLSALNGLIIVAVRFIALPAFQTSQEKYHCIFYTMLCTFLAWTGYKHTNMHLNLSLLNLTSIEYMTLPAFISLNFCQRYGVAWSRISNFDKGWRHNLVCILGEPVLTWFMPWVTPRSPWGPNPVTWYSGYPIRDLYAPPTAQPQRTGPQVNAHNHNVSDRNSWNMWDDPVQHAAEGLRATRLTGQGSLPLIAYQDEDGLIGHGQQHGGHAHGGEDYDGIHEHNHGGGAGGHNHSHGGDHDGHNHSHGGDGDHGHSHGDHGHSHDGGGHNHGNSHVHRANAADDDDMPGLV